MTDRPVTLTTSGPPETVLDAEPAAILEALAAAMEVPDADRRAAVCPGKLEQPQTKDPMIG